MKGRSALLNFTVRMKARLLHSLVQRVAERAYKLGYDDAKEGRPFSSERVQISADQVRKFQ